MAVRSADPPVHPVEHVAHRGKVNPGLAVPLLGVLAALQGADPNIAATALVGASRGLGMTGGLAALAASISTIALAATAITTGLLADRVGRKKALVAGLLVAAIGDLVVVVSPAAPFYLAGRAIAGIGLGAVYGASFAYIRAVVPPNRIPGAIGTFTATTGLAALLLTFIGGTLSSIEWRVAFLAVPVLSLLCIPAVLAILPRQEPHAAGKQDVIGQLLLAFGVVGFLYGVSNMATSLTSPLTLGPILVGTLLLIGFFVAEARNDNRFFPVSLFRDPIFLAALFVGLAYNFTNAVSFLQTTNLWQYATGLKTSEVSVWQLPMLLAGILAAMVFGRLMLRGLSARAVVVIGSTSLVLGFAYLAAFHSATSLLAFAPGLILAGAGVIVLSLPFGTLIISEAPPRYFGPVTSSRTTIGQFFYSMGLALSTVIVDRLTRGGVVEKLEAAGASPSKTGQGLDAVTAYARNSTQPEDPLGKQALADAIGSYGTGYAVAMLLAAAVTVVCGIAAFVLLGRGNHTSGQVRHDEAAPSDAVDSRAASQSSGAPKPPGASGGRLPGIGEAPAS